MLVVLNPGEGTKIDVASMRQDETVAAELSDYVVAEIDASTEHGRQVHELFNSPALPHVVVINAAKKQVYKTSGVLTASQLKSALAGPTTVTANRPISQPIETSTAAAPIESIASEASPSFSSRRVAPATTVSETGLT